MHDRKSFSCYIHNEYTRNVVKDQMSNKFTYPLILCTTISQSCYGTGMYPFSDPWGKPFSKDYCRDRWKLAGTRIAGPFLSCLEDVQGDQDYIRSMMTPARPLAVTRAYKNNKPSPISP